MNYREKFPCGCPHCGALDIYIYVDSSGVPGYLISGWRLVSMPGHDHRAEYCPYCGGRLGALRDAPAAKCPRCSETRTLYYDARTATAFQEGAAVCFVCLLVLEIEREARVRIMRPVRAKKTNRDAHRKILDAIRNKADAAEERAREAISASAGPLDVKPWLRNGMMAAVADLAERAAHLYGEDPETSAGLRKLLEAADCFERAIDRRKDGT